MKENERLKPDPDAILDEIRKDQRKRGRLKIFLGYAPGVGKTYTMLEQARVLKQRGLDVVIGFVETHGRKETEALREGLETLPLKEVKYKTITMRELDVKAVLKRRPALVLVDELAHSNAPGSIHVKRYQDVAEILENNIDVYTTVNVQHCESVNDVVAGVTGIKVRETVPDSVLDEADEIEVVDIPIDELHQRLKEGKVYIPEQARQAVEQFFKRSNLLALREITLRRVATKLDTELVTYMKARAIVGPWPVVERLLVCIAPSPYAKQLIRKAYQLAEDTKAEWYAVYVESVSQLQLSKADRAELARALEFAEEQGAKVITLSGSDVAEEILRFADQEKITKILIGKPIKKGLFGFFKTSPVEKLVRSRREADIYLIEPKVDAKNGDIPKKTAPAKTAFRAAPYGMSLLLLPPVILVGFLFYYLLNIRNFSIIFIVAVMASAFLYGKGPSLFISLLSVLTYDFFFVLPLHTFRVASPEYIIELLIFFATAFTVGEITRLFRQQKEALRIRLENIRTLEQMGRELLGVPSIEQVLDTTGEQKISPEFVETIQMINVDILDQIAGVISRYLTKVVKAANMVIFMDRDGKLKIWARSDAKLIFSENDYAIANWVYNNNDLAGKGTKTLVASDFVFLPMVAEDRTVGVIALAADYALLLPQERYFVSAMASFSAIAAERCTHIINKSQGG
jgi:two-component system sensor histidine kinase KdpD